MNSARTPRSTGRFSLEIQQEVQFPIHQGIVGTRRLKILRIEQTAIPHDENTTLHPHSGEQYLQAPILESPLRRKLPHPASEPPELECLLEGKLVHLREVSEAVTDEAGNFYEVQGQQLMPLDELVMDESGKVFEVRHASETGKTKAMKRRSNGSQSYVKRDQHSYQPSEGRISETHHQHSQADITHDTVQRGTKQFQSQPQASAKGSVRQPVKSSQPQAQANATHNPVQRGVKESQIEQLLSYRKLFAEPGIRLTIPFSQIKREMAPQLKHPEQLEASTLIECYAQIYEAQRTMPVAKIAANELGDPIFHSQFHPLTQDKAAMLGTPQLFKSVEQPFETPASNRQIYPGQRVYRLCPVYDLTTERDTNSSRQSVASGGKATALRSQIPKKYLNPLQFRHSREAVLYDMKAALGVLPPESGILVRWFFIYPLRLLKTLITLILSGRQIKKWRAMLKGKCPDEQLWLVAPPPGFSYHPIVRGWAEDTLIHSGYNSEPMLLEWEIFWRRKGLR
jgi:hypothetical protein